MGIPENDKNIATEIRIFDAAYNQFLRFGYHGTKIRHIAKEANVLPAAVHYYFRSKEKLYVKIVFQVISDIFDLKPDDLTNVENSQRLKWFLQTELYNNQELLKMSLQKLYLNNWENKQRRIEDYLKKL